MVGPTRQALADARLTPEDIDRVILVGGATRMAAVRQLARELMGKEPYVDLPPDEAVALGAAIQAGILTGEIEGRLLIDVTPLSLGIETQGGIFTRLIERNTVIPVSRSRIFTNAADNQTFMDIHILQGERDLAIDNISLGRLELAGVPPAPRGEARVEVAFHIDANGILHVSAHDLYSDSSRKLRISPRFYGLADDEIDRIVEKAQRYGDEDRRRRAEIELGIEADMVVRAARRVLEELDSEANPSLVGEVERGIFQAQTALATGNAEELQRRTRELERLASAMRTARARAPGPLLR